MIVIIIYTIFSFFLDGLVSNYTAINIVDPSYLRTIYSVISLVIIFNYFEDTKKYLYITIFLGVLFDIVYTNTFMLNIILFLIISFILKQLNLYIPNNILTINLKSITCISAYHIMSYLILLLVHYNNYTASLLVLVLYRSIIMTIIYTTISHFIIKKIYFFKYDKKIK